MMSERSANDQRRISEQKWLILLPVTGGVTASKS